ncbi:MAG: PASTA domain-containing protein, partial [Erysipelotrichaceae bacterium]|nr:PASTA domain-containing protein [Erysipelotrichaceae bacterium]
MSEKKDYLSQLAAEIEGKKPESFKEEKLERVERPKVKLDPKMAGIGVAALIVVLALVWFIFLRAKIEMPDFVGQTKADVTAWVRQQGISSSGVIMKEEFSFEFDEDVILSQSVEPGKKVKDDVKLTFTVSMGADPDELIDFPEDVLSMTKEDINEWVDENKLEKVRVSQAYSDEVEEGFVISYDLKGIDREEFTRSTNVTFTVSRGPQPAQTFRLENFVGKYQAEVESWAKSSNIVLDVVESYSEDKADGIVLSQSISAGKSIKEGDTLVITVSKGKAVTLPDFTLMSKEEFTEWTAENTGFLKIKERYSDVGGYVISQSRKAGTQLGSEDDKVEVTLNLGLPKLPEGLGVGYSYQSLVDWCNEERHKGADMYAAQWGSEESTYSTDKAYSKGTIMSLQCSSYSTGETVACNGPLPLDARFDVLISKGWKKKLESIPSTTSELAVFLAQEGVMYTIETSSDDAKLYDKANPEVPLVVDEFIYED